MKHYIVGAYSKGVFHHRASGYYLSRETADAYRLGCTRTCSPLTGMDYKVIEVEHEEDIHDGGY